MCWHSCIHVCRPPSPGRLFPSPVDSRMARDFLALQTQHFGHAPQHLHKSASGWVALQCLQENCPCRRNSLRRLITIGFLAANSFFFWPGLNRRASTGFFLGSLDSAGILAAKAFYLCFLPLLSFGFPFRHGSSVAGTCRAARKALPSKRDARERRERTSCLPLDFL